MAEALFKDILEKKERDLNINVKSAGIYAMEGSPATRQAIDVMKNRNIDLTKHKSKLITNNMINSADLILTMTSSHKDALLKIKPDIYNKVFTLKEYANVNSNIDIMDPYGMPVAEYEKTAKEIKEAIVKTLEKIKNKE